MKTRYYYNRDKNNHPLVTVCLIADEFGNVGRGVAICSPQDNPEKKVGRELAFDRAQWAMVHKAPVREPVSRLNALFVLADCGAVGDYFKSRYNPPLDEFEERILSEPTLQNKRA